MKNKSEDLRNHLFATIEALRDLDKPMDLDRAKTIAHVAQTAINLAKAETEFLETVGRSSGSGFFPQPEPPPAPARSALPNAAAPSTPRLATSRD